MGGSMQIKIHRGTHQIGGSIAEIKTENARIIIDFGAELPRADKTWSAVFEINGVTSGNPDCDAVLITHYHGDHVGMFENILSEIPVYMGATAKKILCAVQKTLKIKLNNGNPERVQTFLEFEAGKPFYIKDVKITPYCIDHSAFDAYMFLIEADGKRILHTGDFRMHGARGKKMPLVFERFAQNIDVLIIEGTMLSRSAEKVMAERELGNEAKKLLRDIKNVFVLCSSTNIDTIAGFYSAAIANKKPFIVCDDMQAEILQTVTETAKSPFYDFSKSKIYTYGFGKNAKLIQYMSDCGFCFIGRANLKTLKAVERFPDNLLIYSMWSGYLDKSRPAFDKYKSDFIEKATENGGKLLYLHTSGHATAEQIKQVCEITQAKTIIPIHSESPEAFRALGINAAVRVLQDGESIFFD
jgi:ribonuclease J